MHVKANTDDDDAPYSRREERVGVTGDRANSTSTHTHYTMATKEDTTSGNAAP